MKSNFPVTSNGNPAYAQKGDIGAKGPELWAMLIEKAYAISEGGYDEIEGGNPGDAMEILTNKESTTYDPSDYEDAVLLKLLKNFLSKKRAITASSSSSSEKKKQAKNAGVVTGHAYILKSVDLSSKTINLHNPWGSKHLNEFSISKFKKYFYRFQVN